MKRLALSLCLLLSLAGVASANGIYVMNAGALAGGNDASVTSYPIAATGNVSPLTTIKGASTGFSSTSFGMSGLCIDPTHSFIWVTDQTNNKLSRFNITDNGNVAPGVTISAGSTTLSRPASCYFNSSGDMWVANIGNSNMLRFSAANLTTSGGPAPSTTFTASDMSAPQSVFVDGSGNIYVGQFGSSACTSANCFAYLFPSTSTGTQTPTAKWTNFQSSSHVQGIGVGNSKLLLGLPSYPNCTPAGGSQQPGVFTYNNDNTSSSAAPDVELCGSTAFPDSSLGLTMAVDANGAVVVPISSGDIRIFYRGASGNVSPDQDIVGASTGLTNPLGIAVVGTFPLPHGAHELWPFP